MSVVAVDADDDADVVVARVGIGLESVVADPDLVPSDNHALCYHLHSAAAGTLCH